MTTNVQNEAIAYMNPALRMWIAKQKGIHTNTTGWNYHKETEIVLILKGQIHFHIDEQVYPLNDGDVVLVGASRVHALRAPYADKEVEKIYFQFDLHHYFDVFLFPYALHFDHMLGAYGDINSFIRSNKRVNDDIFETVQHIYQESRHQKMGFEVAVSLLVKKMLLSLLRNGAVNQVSRASNDAYLLFAPVLEYVQQHLSESIRLEEMSDLAGMSYHHFCRKFKKCFSVNFTDYVNYQRIKEAERLLLTTQLTVADIAERVGFPNVPHFYKTFQKVNKETPRGYKMKLNQSIE